MSRNRTVDTGLGSKYDSQPGPWGILELVQVTLSPPVGLTKYYKQETKLGSWLFPGCAPLQVEGLLREFGCSPKLAGRLLTETNISYTFEGTELHPDAKLILELEPATRTRLYEWLANASEYSTQFNAFRYFGESLDSWLENAKLKPATIELVRPFVYQHGYFLKFADLGAIIPQINDEREVSLLMKALSREITLKVRLNLNNEDDLESLVSYWGRNHRENDVRPILESFAHFEDEHMVDIVHLLPPLPRKLLYTFPRHANNAAFQKQTCYWTALNFFNDLADDRWLNLLEVNRQVVNEWSPISDTPRFGDLALFIDNSERAYHAAVYVADDILFTKNGPSVVRPWMFTHENYLRHFYYRDEPLQVRYYRHRKM
jgi:hypothetical protein